MLQERLRAFLHVGTSSFRGSGNWASPVSDNGSDSLFSCLLLRSQRRVGRVFRPLLHNRSACLYDGLVFGLGPRYPPSRSPPVPTMPQVRLVLRVRRFSLAYFPRPRYPEPLRSRRRTCASNTVEVSLSRSPRTHWRARRSAHSNDDSLGVPCALVTDCRYVAARETRGS